MVSDSTPPTESPDGPDSPGAVDVADAVEMAPADYYELTYRATRAALWDVLGTATWTLFLLAAGLLGFYALVANGLSLAGDGGNAGHAVALGIGVLLFGFAAVRLYGLYRG
jgi:hypothetical protein